MRFIIALATMLALSAANAKEFTVNDNDQAVIAEVCAMAARSPAQTIEISANVANWCVAWGQRVKAASQPKVGGEKEPERPADNKQQ